MKKSGSKKNLTKKLLKHTPMTLLAGLGLVAVFAPTSACAAVDWSGVEGMNTTIKDVIFSAAFRKTALLLGGGMGLWGCWSKGSFVPLLKWGGIGLIANFLPNIVDLLAGL